MAGDPQHSLLLVPVLLRRFIEQLDEDRVIQQLGGDDEPLHFLADVHRQVSLRHAAAGPLLVATARGSRQQAVLRRIGDSGEFPH